jgi:HSP20 family molecular chaperone IbpA
MVAQRNGDNSDLEVTDWGSSDVETDYAVCAHPASSVPTEQLSSETEGLSDGAEHANNDSSFSTVESESEVPAIQRTQSQTAKQQQVCRVVDQLAGRTELIQDLQRISSKLGAEGVEEQRDLQGALAIVSEAQKQARNLGEDLMEDLLTLDSLSNLISEDRKIRKRAISDIESLLGTVDTAKEELGIFRKQIEAKVPEQTRDDKSCSANTSENATPNTATACTRAQAAARSSPVQKVRRMREEQDQTPARFMSENNLFTLSTVPGKELWEQMDLPVEFKSYEKSNCYVVEASVPELDIRDLKLKISADQSRVVVEGVRLPTSAQKSKMQREVALRLEQFARRSPERFAQLGGAPAMSEEAFIKVGQGYFGRFSQTFSIPEDVDVADIEASYDDGKLRVVFPKERVTVGNWGHDMVPFPGSYYEKRMHNPFHHTGMSFF